MASNIKGKWKADDGNLMLGHIEDFLPGSLVTLGL